MQRRRVCYDTHIDTPYTTSCVVWAETPEDAKDLVRKMRKEGGRHTSRWIGGIHYAEAEDM